MTPISADFQALKAHLATITASNGYRTTVAAVVSGKPDLDVSADGVLPALVLLAIDEQAAETGGANTIEAGSRIQYWSRRIMIEGQVSGVGDWESAIDDLLDDTRRALTQFPRPIRIGAPTFAPPSEGNNTGLFVLFAEITYEANFLP